MSESPDDARDELRRTLEMATARVELEQTLGAQVFPYEEIHVSKAEQLEELRQQCLQCTRCPLHRTRTNLVFGEGSPDAELMFVGEAPGYHEDQQGTPFVGAAGELLTKIIKAIDRERSDVYIGNVLKDRPPDNRDPQPQEVASCLPYLIRQIQIIQPKVIVTLGRFAAQALLNTTTGITRLRGQFHECHGAKLMPTYHPAYLLRDERAKRPCWEDMKKVRDELNRVKDAQ